MERGTAIAFIAAAFLVGYVLGRRSGRAAGPLAPPVPPDPAVLERVRPILETQGKIAAIKAYRTQTGVGLRDAKLAVDTLHAPRWR